MRIELKDTRTLKQKINGYILSKRYANIKFFNIDNVKAQIKTIETKIKLFNKLEKTGVVFWK